RPATAGEEEARGKVGGEVQGEHLYLLLLAGCGESEGRLPTRPGKDGRDPLRRCVKAVGPQVHGAPVAAVEPLVDLCLGRISCGQENGGIDGEGAMEQVAGAHGLGAGAGELSEPGALTVRNHRERGSDWPTGCELARVGLEVDVSRGKQSANGLF